MSNGGVGEEPFPGTRDYGKMLLLPTPVAVPMEGREVPKPLGPPPGAAGPAISISLEAQGQVNSGRNAAECIDPWGCLVPGFRLWRVPGAVSLEPPARSLFPPPGVPLNSRQKIKITF